MEKPYFNYAIRVKGQTKMFALPYNPMDYGFELETRKPCCLYFRKGRMQLRIKTATQIVSVYNEKGRPITRGALVPQSTESFEKILEECSLR